MELKFTHVSCLLFLAFTCSDSIFGAGNLGDVRNGDCNKEMAGYQVARCNSSNLWQPIEDYCVLRIFATLKDEAEAN